MDDTWDARAWVASVLGCNRSDLTVRSRNEGFETGTQVRYDMKGKQAARLIVAGPIRTLNGEPEGHWVIALELPDRTTRSAPHVPESKTILF